MNEKKRKVVLLTKNNYKESVLEVLINTEYEFLIILYFDRDTYGNMELLNVANKYFNTKDKNSHLENVIILSSREYLANDLLVKGIVIPKDIQNFKYYEFVKVYEKSTLPLDKFISLCSKEYNYTFDLYNSKNPWIYHQNKTNILLLTHESHSKILDNYHKIKLRLPEIIVSIFNGENDSKLIKMLKLIGADASIIFTFINDLTVEYSKRSDVFIHIKQENFEEIGKNFINDIFYHTEYPEGINILRKFLGIPKKNFEADMTYDEEKEIAKKPKKYYSLKVEKGNSLKTEIIEREDALLFNIGLSKLYTLCKYEL